MNKPSALTKTINATVTPRGGHGPNVQCDITGSPPDVVNNAVFVPLNTDATIYFTLVPGNGVAGWKSNASNGAFCSDLGKCPVTPSPAPGTKQGQFTAQPPAGNVLQVDVSASPNRSVAHYRLEFDSGSCDPIIINT